MRDQLDDVSKAVVRASSAPLPRSPLGDDQISHRERRERGSRRGRRSREGRPICSIRRPAIRRKPSRRRADRRRQRTHDAVEQEPAQRVHPRVCHRARPRGVQDRPQGQGMRRLVRGHRQPSSSPSRSWWPHTASRLKRPPEPVLGEVVGAAVTRRALPRRSCRRDALDSAKRPFGGSLDDAICPAGFEPAKPGPRRRTDVDPEHAHREVMSPRWSRRRSRGRARLSGAWRFSKPSSSVREIVLCA